MSINDITIQIVLYEESEDLLTKCLNLIKDFKIIIVDNSSNNKLKKKILSKFEIEQYILSDKNLGYSKGHNIASEYVKTKFLLIMNADCFIEKKDILILKKKYESYQDCGLIAPTSFNYEGQITYNGGLLPEFGDKKIPINLDGDICVQSVLGSCMFLNYLEFQKIGKFDENMFLFFSDDYLCKKIKESSKSVIQTYDAKCLHMHGISKVKNTYKKTFLLNYYMTLDHLVYFSKVKNSSTIENLKFKKIYIYKFLINLLKFNFIKATYFLSKILAHYKFKNIKNIINQNYKVN